MLQEGELDRLRDLLDTAMDLPAFQVETSLARTGSSPAEREKTLSEVAPVLKAMGETVGRDELIRRVESVLDTEPGLVARRVESAVLPSETAPAREAQSGEDAPPLPPAPDLPLTPRERKERSLLAMCIAQPGAGKEVLSRIGDEILTSDLMRRAVAWLRDHVDDPASGLPREDEELVALISQLVMSAGKDPASAEAMEQDLLELEKKALEDRLTAARAAGDWSSVKVLSSERAELVTKIAGAERV
jgi:DNA primase